MPSSYPTPWQQKTLWAAITAIAIVTIGAVSVGAVWLAAHILGFLQPILIPFAVAGVLAYLLDPVVSKMTQWGIPRKASVLSVFSVVSALLIWGAFWVVPAISHQTANLVRKADDYTRTTRQHVTELAKSIRQKYGFDVLPPALAEPSEDETSTPQTPAATPKPPQPEPEKAGAPARSASSLENFIDVQQILKGDWLKNSLTSLVNDSARVLRSSVGGFLSVFGFLVSLIIIPIYLFYFLIDARDISSSWQDYLPLRNSQFKTELVETLNEINSYIIAFFRGQLLVSLINGTATAAGLMIVGLDFGLLIGLVLCVLGLIPYLGILVCWVPAVIIASMQNGAGTWIPADPAWIFPLVVTGIFVLVQKIDSFFITPKVVASRVGLHPLTVIVSLFVWSLLIGGLLGTILAVPLTATLKVILKRYVWERQILGTAPALKTAPQPQDTPSTETPA